MRCPFSAVAACGIPDAGIGCQQVPGRVIDNPTLFQVLQNAARPLLRRQPLARHPARWLTNSGKNAMANDVSISPA